MSFGARTAEEEADALAKYFVQTDQWKRMLRGEIDVVYGPKGSGKSAIYTLIEKSSDELFLERNIITATAENPRGATVFRNIIADPPASERDFIALWKTYILCIVARRLPDYNISNAEAKKIINTLTGNELLPASGGLAAVFSAVKRFFARKISREPTAVTYSATIDQQTGIPIPTRTAQYDSMDDAQNNESTLDIDALFETLDKALEYEGFKLWVLFDRLDVAFEESRELEKNALRALFRVYNDLRLMKRLSLKIFVRDDIWNRITESGFAEASHITRAVTIKWDNSSLLNLAVRRLLSNESIADLVGGNVSDIMSDIKRQRTAFYKFFPDQIDTGANKPDTFEWILGRTNDGSGLNAPRELIHFLTELRDEQIRRLERGESVPPDGLLFDRSIFKTALKVVSETRLNQTLLAEYSEFRPYLVALRGEKTLHTPDTLAKIWSIDASKSREIASALASAGFFEIRGEKQNPQYWVPFLYRDSLEMIQGTADT